MFEDIENRICDDYIHSFDTDVEERKQCIQDTIEMGRRLRRHHHTKRTQVSRGVLRLSRQPEDVDGAVADFVKSGGGGGSIESAIKRLSKLAKANLTLLSPEGLNRARALADRLPGDRPHRIAALAYILYRSHCCAVLDHGWRSVRAIEEARKQRGARAA